VALLFSLDLERELDCFSTEEIVRPENKKRKRVEKTVGDGGVGVMLKRRAIYA
jgi:hypothetical protein